MTVFYILDVCSLAYGRIGKEWQCSKSKLIFNNDLSVKQNITDNTLTTVSKTITGAINEINYNALRGAPQSGLGIPGAIYVRLVDGQYQLVMYADDRWFYVTLNPA